MTPDRHRRRKDDDNDEDEKLEAMNCYAIKDTDTTNRCVIFNYQSFVLFIFDGANSFCELATGRFIHLGFVSHSLSL